ncbi:hypothetical protein NQ315_012960 [Exocentrus adspersus]|uniref:DDE-1 domain-containing protein n=1 Tax=Exocentrus adspersus TaxID=1586481 RepID=A0AAV8VRM8_9CUCU|nr:hypothetical protein NQ315_012960 [Exocentrus adspersus]
MDFRNGERGFLRKIEDLVDSVQRFLKANPRKNPFADDRPEPGWGVLKDPNRVFNGDKTCFQICPNIGRVLAQKGSKNVYDTEKGSSKENVTVMFSFLASGYICPPLIVYPYKRIPEKIANSVPKEWGIARSDSGWMTADVFYEYIANVFDPYLVKHNIALPVILFVGRHKSHITYDLGEVITKLNVAPLLSKVIATIKPESVIPLKVCGLYPWDANAVDYSKSLGSTTTTNNIALNANASTSA